MNDNDLKQLQQCVDRIVDRINGQKMNNDFINNTEFDDNIDDPMLVLPKRRYSADFH